MKSINRSGKGAFTLVEIMIVVAIIGLLAALAVPGFIKARKQSQGRRIVNDARQMDAAIDQWAQEKGKKDGDPVDMAGRRLVPEDGMAVPRPDWQRLLVRQRRFEPSADRGCHQDRSGRCRSGLGFVLTRLTKPG